MRATVQDFEIVYKDEESRYDRGYNLDTGITRVQFAFIKDRNIWRFPDQIVDTAIQIGGLIALFRIAILFNLIHRLRFESKLGKTLDKFN